jgi:hypothetical protein
MEVNLLDLNINSVGLYIWVQAVVVRWDVHRCLRVDVVLQPPNLQDVTGRCLNQVLGRTARFQHVEDLASDRRGPVEVQADHGGIRPDQVEQAVNVAVHGVLVIAPPREPRALARRDPGPAVVPEPGEGYLAHWHVQEEHDAGAASGGAGREHHPVVHVLVRQVDLQHDRLVARLGVDGVRGAALLVRAHHDVVEPGDGRERGLGARDGVEEVQVGGLVGDDQPAVAGAQQGPEGERGPREGDLQRCAGGRAVERGGAGGEGAAGVEQAGGLPRRRGAEPAEGGVRRVPGGADGAGADGTRDVQRQQEADQELLRQAGPIAASDNAGAGATLRCLFHSDVRARRRRRRRRWGKIKTS